jgi:hypothetical protein
MHLPRAYQIIEVIPIAALADTAQDVPINNRVFMISNTGAQPIYFNPKGVATAANGMLLPANTVFPMYFSCDGNLSVISNATGSSLAVLILDV